jgi:hypothetical protein
MWFEVVRVVQGDQNGTFMPEQHLGDRGVVN